MQPDDAAHDSLKATIAVADATLEQNPRATISPAPVGPDTAGHRAVEALSEIASAQRDGARPSLEMERTLGEGGMGVVHLATQVALGRKVAVKTLRSGVRSPAMTLKLLREAWVTGSLEHPNVVPVYDVAVDAEGSPVIVLKRIEGVEWATLLCNGEQVRERFGAKDLLEWNIRILMQLCNAVHFAHSRGIVHRDLKPENVMIGEFGEVYLLDWGIAVSLRDDGSGRLPLASQAREMAGTPCYMAPEMLGSEQPRLTERTDVYLLGAILFEIVTGNPPHEGDSMIEILAHVARGEPSLPEDVPAELARLCRRAMDRDPDARFENAEQVRLALQGFLLHRGSAQLSAQSELRLEQLTRDLAAPDSHDPAARRVQLYNLFGECRFGFQQAVRSWSENERARVGLRRAIELMVDYELAQRDSRAAALLLSEIDEPAVELVARVRASETARGEEQARVRALERLGQQHDASVGRNTRAFLASILGVTWTITPLIAQWFHIAESHVRMILQPLGLLVGIAALGIWARDSMMKTAINRTLIGAAMLALSVQLFFQVGLALLGVSVVTARVLNLALWASVAAVVALTVERRLFIPSIAYIAAFLLACVRPEYRYYLAASANLVLTGYMLFLWAPRKERTAPSA